MSSLQFGWEIEYRPEDSAPLLSDYALREDLMPPREWESLALEEKTQWLRQEISRRPLGDKSMLLKKREGAESFLPNEAFRDDTGNLELRSEKPLHDFAEVLMTLRRIIAKYGPGSMQMTVSRPTEEFFRSGPTSVREHLGWLNFFNELDILEKLASAQKRAQRDDGKDLVKNFQHPYLGPMNRRRHNTLVNYLEENSQGRLWSQGDLDWAGRRESSFKFVGSTAYRPDIAGPERICYEVRDAHKDLSRLEARARRIVLHWNRGTEEFARFSKLSPFDSAKTFDDLPASVRTMLESFFPCRAPKILKDFPKHLLMHQTYRNFSYPLRDWSMWLQVLGLPAESMDLAQRAYREELESLAVRFADGKLHSRLRWEVQRALVEFAVRAPLLKALQQIEKEIALAGRERGIDLHGRP